MSRDQISLPPKSNALRMPVPVMIQTCCPSVTGDGVDMFCLRSVWFPPLTCCFHNGAPVPRFTAHRDRFPPSATLRKTWLSQTIGVDPDHVGRVRRQAMPSLRDHVSGTPVSVLTPLPDGPRHCGHCSAR